MHRRKLLFLLPRKAFLILPDGQELFPSVYAILWNHNTTYTINFGNAIKDFNESNPLKDFTYTFSTGKYIDSLEFSGNVILAESGKIDTTLIVMLHTNPADSAVRNERPRYIAKLDSKGSFTFKNLPPKTFYVYALKDDGGTRRYFSNKQVFAFADQPVVVDGKTSPLTLYAYSEKDTTGIPSITAPSTRTAPARERIGRTGVTTLERLRYQTNLLNATQDLLTSFIMTFEQPLKFFDSTKISLYTDSTFTPVPDSAYSFKYDSTSRQATLKNTWKENVRYHIILEKDFAEDKSGKKLLKTDTLSFTTKKMSEYGQLKLKFRNLDMAKNPVLLFVVNENIVKTVRLTNAEFSSAVFLPGDYELRILYDTNRNGVWDPGQFFGKKRQPELVKPIDRRITVKAAWENEFEIQN